MCYELEQVPAQVLQLSSNAALHLGQKEVLVAEATESWQTPLCTSMIVSLQSLP